MLGRMSRILTASDRRSRPVQCLVSRNWGGGGRAGHAAHGGRAGRRSNFQTRPCIPFSFPHLVLVLVLVLVLPLVLVLVLPLLPASSSAPSSAAAAAAAAPVAADAAARSYSVNSSLSTPRIPTGAFRSVMS